MTSKLWANPHLLRASLERADHSLPQDVCKDRTTRPVRFTSHVFPLKEHRELKAPQIMHDVSRAYQLSCPAWRRQLHCLAIQSEIPLRLPSAASASARLISSGCWNAWATLDRVYVGRHTVRCGVSIQVYLYHTLSQCLRLPAYMWDRRPKCPEREIKGI